MKTLRLMNERTGFFGMSIVDLAGLGYFLIATHGLLGKVGLELFSFVLTSLLAILIIHVRITKRPHFMRDFIKYYLTSRKLR
ncbi:MAG: hypothetical protein H7235_06065 [Bdellovibrionaceae bacterium]|nr:hypothetical protein [Pseudobdellovibrionaceae bacterium]